MISKKDFRKPLMYFLTALGTMYLVMPHEWHMEYLPFGLSELSHTTHLVLGVVSLVTAYLIWKGKILK